MLTRRDTLALGVGAAVITLLPVSASATPFDDAVAEYTGGAAVTEGGVTITAPEIAENGNTVPLAVQAEGATEIAAFADGNPFPMLCRVAFGPASGSPMLGTRIRLGRTQNVRAIAKMADGSFRSAQVEVKVTIGGCGG